MPLTAPPPPPPELLPLIGLTVSRAWVLPTGRVFAVLFENGQALMAMVMINRTLGTHEIVFTTTTESEAPECFRGTDVPELKGRRLTGVKGPLILFDDICWRVVLVEVVSKSNPVTSDG